MEWNPSRLLHLGMDGLKVNLRFRDSYVQVTWREKWHLFLILITHTLQNFHNAFANGMKFLNFDVEQFIVEINCFFKLSSVHRDDFRALEEITELSAQFTIKHSSTCWVALKKVAVRILKQWKNLIEYFLVIFRSNPVSKGKRNQRKQKISTHKAWCPPPLSAGVGGGGGWASYQIFKKEGFGRTSALRGGLLGGWGGGGGYNF